MHLDKNNILVSLKMFVLSVLLLVSTSHAHAVVSSMTASMPNDVDITTTVDTDDRTITYLWDFTTLPGDYGQVDINIPGISLTSWCSSSCAVGTDITQITIFDAAGGAAENRLQMEYQGGAAPPRINSVVLTYNSAHMFTGEFVDGSPIQADSDGNVLVSYRDPLGGEEGKLWAFTPVIVPIGQTNIAPVAVAGPDQNVAQGSTVMISGSDSYDFDNDPLTYSWTWSRPTGSAAMLSNSATVNSTFVANVAGPYTVRLIVNDGKVDSTADDLQVIVSEVVVPNTAPVANAGMDQFVLLADTVALDGSDSIDADGDALTFRWVLTAPVNSGTTLSDATAAAPSFIPDMASTYTVVLTVNDGTADSAADSVVITVENLIVNNAPVAAAGTDQTVFVGDHVLLDGSDSTDIDGNLLTYHWTLTSPLDSTASLSGEQEISPTFTPDVEGTYTAVLVVNDGVMDSTPDSADIVARNVVLNTPPIADAGQNQSAFVNLIITLDGSGSSDADADALSYHWSLSIPTESVAVLAGATEVVTTFVADMAGDYVAQLIVNDGSDDSVADTVMISVSSIPVNTRPEANAGLDQSVFVGATVTLDGSGSYNVDGDGLRYRWSFISRPTGSSATLYADMSVNPGFIADTAGTYVVQLIVNDGASDSLPVTVSIPASNEPVNMPPMADAGPDQIAVKDDLVTLSGAASSDPNSDDILTYLWSFTSRPTSSLATLSGPTLVNPTFIADATGAYVVQLIVNDVQYDSLLPDTVTIQVYDVTYVSTGQRLYVENCAHCHGDDARGGMVGVDIHDKDAEKPQDSIVRLHPLSVHREFTRTEIEQIADYLDKLGRRSGRHWWQRDWK